MSQHIVGEIEHYDVIYVPEKDIIFCKNTTVPYKLMKAVLIDREMDRVEIKSDLVASINKEIVQLGCLSTTVENCESINKQIKKIKISYGKIKRTSTAEN